jgi:hypothetical protein
METVGVIIGLTVTTTSIGVPEQAFAVGVIVYVAVPVDAPVVVRVWAIELPLPAEAPDTPDWDTVHANVVPVTELVKEILVCLPEQNSSLAGFGITSGVGFTVTLTVWAMPAQLPVVEVGVTE